VLIEQGEYRNLIEIFGTKGAIRVDHRGEVFFVKSGETEWTRIETAMGRPIPGVPDTGFSRGFMEFAPAVVSAIREGKTEIENAATFDDGLKVQRVLDAARESDQTGARTLLLA